MLILSMLQAFLVEKLINSLSGNKADQRFVQFSGHTSSSEMCSIM